MALTSLTSLNSLTSTFAKVEFYINRYGLPCLNNELLYEKEISIPYRCRNVGGE